MLIRNVTLKKFKFNKRERVSTITVVFIQLPCTPETFKTVPCIPTPGGVACAVHGLHCSMWQCSEGCQNPLLWHLLWTHSLKWWRLCKTATLYWYLPHADARPLLAYNSVELAMVRSISSWPIPVERIRPLAKTYPNNELHTDSPFRLYAPFVCKRKRAFSHRRRARHIDIQPTVTISCILETSPQRLIQGWMIKDGLMDKTSAIIQHGFA